MSVAIYQDDYETKMTKADFMKGLYPSVVRAQSLTLLRLMPYGGDWLDAQPFLWSAYFFTRIFRALTLLTSCRLNKMFFERRRRYCSFTQCLQRFSPSP